MKTKTSDEIPFDLALEYRRIWKGFDQWTASIQKYPVEHLMGKGYILQIFDDP